MGISGLLPLIKESLVPKHLKDYAGKRIAVDAYVWLHKGVYTCAQEVALGQPTNKYVAYCMSRVRLLQHYGITPYIVFDGGPLPSKGGTETDRASKRQAALQKANAYLAAGNSNAARDEFVKAVDVTPAMAYQVIKALKEAHVDYVVAPYEADAQLAFLERKGYVDAILSEDSDLVVFGCAVILFKLDPAGAVVEYRRDRLTMCNEYRFDDWTDDRLRHMAIVSGCDYLDGLNGMGLKSAYGLFQRFKKSDKVIQHIRMSGKIKVPQHYDRDFRRADLTFQHQRIFDPETRQAIHLTPLPRKGMSDAEIEAVGGLMTSELALGIATGDIDPSTSEAMIDINAGLASPFKTGSKAPKASTSFYKAKETKGAVSAGPLDSFFARKPTARAKSTKRPALNELKANVPARTAAPAVNMPQVASRFFGKPSPPPVAPIELPEPDADELSALMDVEADSSSPIVAREVSCTDVEVMSSSSSQVPVAAETTTEMAATTEPSECPTSEMVCASASPSPRKRRRLLDEDAAGATPVKVAHAEPIAASPSLSAYVGSPISSPPMMATPTRKLVSDWHQRFKHSSSSSTGDKAAMCASKPLRGILAPSSSFSSVDFIPTASAKRKLDAVLPPAIKPAKVARVSPPSSKADRVAARPSAKVSPLAEVKSTPTGNTSHERPLSSFLYRHPS